MSTGMYAKPKLKSLLWIKKIQNILKKRKKEKKKWNRQEGILFMINDQWSKQQIVWYTLNFEIEMFWFWFLIFVIFFLCALFYNVCYECKVSNCGLQAVIFLTVFLTCYCYFMFALSVLAGVWFEKLCVTHARCCCFFVFFSWSNPYRASLFVCNRFFIQLTQYRRTFSILNI